MLQAGNMIIRARTRTRSQEQMRVLLMQILIDYPRY